ncbi:MAG TPA: hypothetical protein EYN51_03605, partial [Flavobacteriales bacterium]|nr:hypothetical protein [Flavobacteriales bacterium]
NGYYALFSNTTGYSNIANGSYALRSNTTGYSNTANGYRTLYSSTTGSNNTANGYSALYYNTSGSYNTANGYYALYSNTTSSNRSALGYSANSLTGAYTNSTGLGYNADCTAANQVRIGNNSVTSIGGYVSWTNLSDARFKENIEENVKGLAFIAKLRPVTYNMSVHKVEQFIENHYGEVDSSDWPSKYVIPVS